MASSPAAVDGMVYVGGDDGNLYYEREFTLSGEDTAGEQAYAWRCSPSERRRTSGRIDRTDRLRCPHRGGARLVSR